MNYRMVEEQGATVWGKSVIVHEDAYKEIPVFVEGIWKDGTHDQINELLGRPAGALLYGYHFDFNEDGSRHYLMGAEVPDDIQVPDGFTVLHIPDQTYAVFDSRGTMTDDVEIDLSIMDVWKRIYTEWFPSMSFEQAEGPCIEKYKWVDGRQQDFMTEVWVPVRKKADGIA